MKAAAASGSLQLDAASAGELEHFLQDPSGQAVLMALAAGGQPSDDVVRAAGASPPSIALLSALEQLQPRPEGGRAVLRPSPLQTAAEGGGDDDHDSGDEDEDDEMGPLPTSPTSLKEKVVSRLKGRQEKKAATAELHKQQQQQTGKASAEIRGRHEFVGIQD